HHLAVERQHVVVVVADRESRVDEARLTGREIETIEPAARLRIRAARVVDQRRTVWRPIRRLEGLLRAEDDLAVPATYVEQLESAADVVAIGREVGLRRAREPHVAEDDLLDDIRIVRAQEQPDLHLVVEP